MADELTLQAVSGITDPDQIRITLFINNQQVHAPLVDVVVVASAGTYLPLTGGTLTGPLLGTAATFSGLLTTNGQVAFPATQNPSANANTLDDYEEGTFTPNLKFGGAAVGMTYASRVGFYTKIGDSIQWSIFLNLSAKGSSTGSATIDGLPFTSNSTAGYTSSANYGYYAAAAGIVGIPFALLSGGVTSLTMLHGGAANAATQTEANFTNTTALVLSGIYKV